jgi:hypothetical protein
LAAQTLPAGRFEIVLVSAGAEEVVRDGVAQFAAVHPEHRPRLCTLAETTPGSARNVGLRAARGVHSVFVEQHDQVAPGLLEALLRRTEPGVVPVSLPAGMAPSAAEPGELLLCALESEGAKLVPTAMARTVRYEDGHGRWMEFAYWLALAGQAAVRFDVEDANLERGAGTRPARADDDFAAVRDRLALIQYLRERRTAPGDGHDLAEQMVQHQAGRIREFLLRHPERHPDVVAEVRGRGIVEMPWPAVNRGRARHLALLYLFSPFLDTSALVAARRLRERGWVTDVVSQDVSNVRTRETGADAVAAEVVDEIRMLPGSLPEAHWSSVVTFAERALAEVHQLESDKGSYETVYSRAMAVQSHFAAAVLKLRSPGTRWVVEFSDPLSRNAYGEIRVGDLEEGWLVSELAEGFRAAGHEVPRSTSFFEWAELICYAFADEIIFTNQHQLDFMLGYCEDRSLAQRAAGISRASHHPVPTSDLYAAASSRYRLSPDQVHIGYFGNFYANRGLAEVTGALEQLTPAERDRVQLHVFTAKPEPLVLETLERGLVDVVTANPMLGYLEYLNLTRRFDVLLITDFATRPHYDPNPFLPAKLADYLGSGSRIWAVHEPGSVLSTVEVDYSSELGDVDSATRVLRELAGSDTKRSLA